MIFLEALYGSQYSEISKNGKDGNKGRLNGNVILSAIILMVTISGFLLMCSLFKIHWYSQSWIPGLSGKALGRILGLVMFFSIYNVVSKSIGNEARFREYVKRFLAYPEEIQKTANKMIMLRFAVSLIFFIIMVFIY